MTSILIAALTYFLLHKPQIPPQPTPKPLLDQQQEVWLDALEWQESRGNEKAINPHDSDGTPSYGCLQFKPGTFNLFSGIYHIATTSLMNCDQQRDIVAHMIVDQSVNLRHQFPLSIKKIGLPPQ